MTPFVNAEPRSPRPLPRLADLLDLVSYRGNRSRRLYLSGRRRGGPFLCPLDTCGERSNIAGGHAGSFHAGAGGKTAAA